MYILKNAFISILRNKTRNFLLGCIVFVIAISSCIALSIREAATTAKEETINNLNITARISFDRSSMMEKMRENGEASKGNFDKDALKGDTLTLSDYKSYAKAQSDYDSYYYSSEISLNTADEDDLQPYSSEDEEESEDENTNNDKNMPDMPGGMGGNQKDKFKFEAQGDFAITGYSSYKAVLSLFGQDGGTYSISEGSMFDEDSTDLECIISDELAMYNELEVGDKIKLVNPNDEDDTYKLKVVGIYTNSSSDEGNSAFSRQDPANNIYMNYNALNKILKTSKKLGHTEENSDGEETSLALTSQLNFTYTFASLDNYETFEKKVYDLGLSEDYIVSSSDVTAYENSMTPLNTLSKTAGWFFLIVLIVGGIILVVINMFSLRERKYELGVLTAIGMKKWRVALQFVVELFIVTFLAIVIGTAGGAAASVPVTNSLLENQIQSSQESAQANLQNFGFDKGGAPGSNSDKGSGNEPNNQPGGNKQDRTFAGMESPVNQNSYIDSISSATNLTVIWEVMGVGIALTILSSFIALITIMRYEPLKILSSRS